MDIEVKERISPVINETEVYTIITDNLPLANEKLTRILSKNQNAIPPEMLEYFTKRDFPPQRRRGENVYIKEEGIHYSAVGGTEACKTLNISNHN